jgi:hypothetical protein
MTEYVPNKFSYAVNIMERGNEFHHIFEAVHYCHTYMQYTHYYTLHTYFGIDYVRVGICYTLGGFKLTIMVTAFFQISLNLQNLIWQPVQISHNLNLQIWKIEASLEYKIVDLKHPNIHVHVSVKPE